MKLVLDSTSLKPFSIEGERPLDREVIPISKNNATVFLSPPELAGGLGGVKEYCMILEKWYYFCQYLQWRDRKYES
ncbi:hypothetical protein [Microcoleus sp.]|uniref:hypothetical protein n=1 Tax=Microcoleus sp. TaxID=44472 RepID=UPI0035941997